MHTESRQADPEDGLAQEISGRVRAFQVLLKREGIELALVRQNADIFYLTGTVQDGHLLIPADGDPLKGPGANPRFPESCTWGA